MSKLKRLSGATFKYSVEQEHLLAYARGLFGFAKKPFMDIDLRLVRFISWYVSPFSHEQTVRLELWDGKPDLVPGLLPGDVGNQAQGVHELGWIRTPDLLRNPEAHGAFVEALAPKIWRGELTSMVKLGSLLPLAPIAA